MAGNEAGEDSPGAGPPDNVPPDDPFSVRRLAHLVTCLQRELSRTKIAHDQLNDLYCALYGKYADLEDDVSKKETRLQELETCNVKLSVEAESATSSLSALRGEAGTLRDERTLWKSRAHVRLVVAWALGLSLVALAVYIRGHGLG